jgi:hypothetical protein
MRIIITDVDMALSDEYQRDAGNLSWQTGWWDQNGDILIWKPRHNTRLKQTGAAVHEILEWIFIHKLWFPRRTIGRGKIFWSVYCNLLHYVANILECFVSLFTSSIIWDKDRVTFWAWQYWE